VCADHGVDGVLFHAFSGGFALNPDMAEIVRISRSAGKPLFCWLLGEREAARDFQERTQDLGVPVFRDLDRAVECMAAVFRKKSAIQEIHEPKQLEKIPLSETLENIFTDQVGFLDEHVSKKILSAYGIPTVTEKVVTDEKEALAVSSELGFPVVMKGLLPGQAHKTEAGLVRMGLQTKKDVSDAFAFFYKKIAESETGGKIILQSQLPNNIEMIAGLIHDPQFGKCVMCGFGGILTEIIGDSEFAVAPIGLSEALDLICRLKNQKFLDGFRSFPAVNREQLADILVRLGQIGLDYPQIKEIDINPLLNSDDGLMAVDALIVL
jgi:acetate---CoA ligase (ADP-forming)